MISSLKGQSIYEVYPQMEVPSVAYKANNKYANFPPIMNDGRAVAASWQPGAVVDEAIRKDNNITSNWQYRRYLTKNSEEIKSHNFKQACNDIGYYIRNENKDLVESITCKMYKKEKNLEKLCDNKDEDESSEENCKKIKEHLAKNKSQLILTESCIESKFWYECTINLCLNDESVKKSYTCDQYVDSL